MTVKKPSGNNNIISEDKEKQNAEIEFPVTFNLKAVIDASASDEINMKKIDEVFNKLKIKSSYLGNKKSSKGTYVSYNFKVTLQNKPQLETLYSDLKNVPGLKFAI